MAKLIDIRAAVSSKFPQKAARIPSWVYAFAEWLICQKDMNKILTKAGDAIKGQAFADMMTQELHVGYQIHGMDNLPDSGRFVLVSNHPLGAFDGISYIKIFGKKYPKFKVIVNDLLMYIEPLQSVFLPVNTLGKQKREDMEAIRVAYESQDTQILSFPAGFCSRWIDGKIQDVPWKKSVISQATEYQRDIVPMHFEGRNSAVFYGLEWLRRKLGMKFNIGLPLLPRQMMRTARNKTFTIRIGKPIPWQTFDETKSANEWAQWLRQQCYSLKAK